MEEFTVSFSAKALRQVFYSSLAAQVVVSTISGIALYNLLKKKGKN